MIVITCDINALVSGTYWSRDSFKVLDMVDNGEIENIISHEIISDYNEACDSDEIIEKVARHNLIPLKTREKIPSMSKLVHPKEKLKVVKDDPDDDKIVEAAVEGKADYIITYDNHLLKLKEFRGIKIVAPKEFLDILNQK